MFPRITSRVGSTTCATVVFLLALGSFSAVNAETSRGNSAPHGGYAPHPGWSGGYRPNDGWRGYGGHVEPRHEFEWRHHYFPGFIGFSVGGYPWYYDSYFLPYAPLNYGGYIGGYADDSIDVPEPPLSSEPPQSVNVETPVVPETAALIGVRLPANAELWVNGQKMTQAGSFRQFVSPSLVPGQEYSYEVRARWNENNQVVERTRRLSFRAGDRMLVNFLQAPHASAATAK